MEEEDDIFTGRDVCISKVLEDELWHTLRFIYNNQTIPKETQLKCYYASTENKNIIFHSFNFDYLIEEEKKKPYIPYEFVLEDNNDIPQKDVFQRIMCKYPDVIKQINGLESVLFFCYDERMDRFVILSDNMGIIRGVSYWLEDEFKRVVPWMMIDSLTFHYAGEGVRLQFESESKVDNLRIRVPHMEVSPALTPPRAPKREYEESYEYLNKRQRSVSWCEWLNCLV